MCGQAHEPIKKMTVQGHRAEYVSQMRWSSRWLEVDRCIGTMLANAKHQRVMSPFSSIFFLDVCTEQEKTQEKGLACEHGGGYPARGIAGEFATNMRVV